METKRADDDVQDGLWRIHNSIYDLTEFIEKHPGGTFWLENTKGHDITEAVEAHHVNLHRLAPHLARYKIGDTTKPRNSKLTFDRNGFYVTLRNRVAEILPTLEENKLKSLSKVRNFQFFEATSRQLTNSIFIQVLCGRFVRRNVAVGYIGVAMGKLFVIIVVCSNVDVDGHCRAQFLPSARQLSNVLFQYVVHEFPRLADNTRFIASFVSEFVSRFRAASIGAAIRLDAHGEIVVETICFVAGCTIRLRGNISHWSHQTVTPKSLKISLFWRSWSEWDSFTDSLNRSSRKINFTSTTLSRWLYSSWCIYLALGPHYVLPSNGFWLLRRFLVSYLGSSDSMPAIIIQKCFMKAMPSGNWLTTVSPSNIQF